jgi:16S rRNA C967 or C1407 C5-methylase (RsmB/RsmF family)
MNFPSSFLQFCEENNIDIKLYEKAKEIPRYIRMKENFEEFKVKFENESKTKLKTVKWLPPGFFEFDSSIKIVNTECYKKAEIYGMDASSALAVSILDLKKGDSGLVHDCLTFDSFRSLLCSWK